MTQIEKVKKEAFKMLNESKAFYIVAIDKNEVPKMAVNGAGDDVISMLTTAFLYDLEIFDAVSEMVNENRFLSTLNQN